MNLERRRDEYVEISRVARTLLPVSQMCVADDFNSNG